MSAPVPKCPKGCSASLVTKIVTAANIGLSDKSRFVDRKMKDIARQFGDTAVNNRYDRSRIDMTSGMSIEKKQMLGIPYSVPLDPKTGVSGYLGSTATPELSVSEFAKQTASEGLQSTHIAHDDKGTTKLPEAA
jgi:hypothetical protein